MNTRGKGKAKILQSSSLSDSEVCQKLKHAEYLMNYDTQPSASSSPSPSPSPGSVQSDVITTSLLALYGVSFNTRYKHLICTSCAEGFPLGSLHTHLKSDGAKRPNWDSAMKCWKETAVVYENHPWASGGLGTRDKFKKKIVTSLISEGYIAEEGEICDANNSTSWRELSLPEFTGELRPQVLGLRTFPQAIQCTVLDGGIICGHIFNIDGIIQESLDQLPWTRPHH